ncbi:hypothetical protein WA026_000750 [Henosepilachna vigintioctopunctata]|uniref:Uncharacterized protein n=1 Tax=Henosepilachna vigintioctopunctata TaxID=420089 RepID=A0AAW1V8X9_9CUCU
MRQFILSIIVFVLYQHSAESYKVQSAPFPAVKPSWLKVCRRTDPHLNQCVTDLLVEMFPYLATGIPELNIEQFEPLHLDKVSISKGHGAIVLAGSLFDMVVHGPSNSTPTYTELDLKNKKWNLGVDFAHLDIKSRYHLKGHILVLPIVGHGNCDLNLSNIKTKVETNITMRMKEGREIIFVDQMKVNFSVGNMKIKLYNLFNGNKVLGETLNNFINKNAAEITAELSGSINESMSDIFIHLLNNIFSKLPTDLWLLTDEEFEKYNAKQELTTAKAISAS